MAEAVYRPFRWRPGLINISAIATLLFALSFLPADTSLSELRKTGVLRVCVPAARPPLLTGDAARPGYDAEVLADLARRMGLRLSLRISPAMGTDFNPRNWRLNRGQCELIAGGVVDSAETRGFLQTIPTGAMTGWAVILPEGDALSAGMTAAVLPAPGLDRLALSRAMRTAGVRVSLAADTGQMIRELSDGTVAAGITGRAIADDIIAKQAGFIADWLRIDGAGPVPFAVGAWKGDVSLRRAVAGHIAEAEGDGTLTRLREVYGLGG